MYIKKTKIVATIGPATRDPKTLKKMVLAGMSVVRMNMSHGDHAEHAETLRSVEIVRKQTGRPVPVLLDLCGPKIRIGDFSTESIELKNGTEFIVTTKSCVGDEKRVSINVPTLHKTMKPGMMILINDGKNKLEVTKIVGQDIYTRVIVGGMIRGRRGVNLPGAYLDISCLTEKDLKDLAWGIKQGVDFVAISFVRRGSDITELRNLLKKYKSPAKIIAKLETPESLDNLDEIIELTDSVMVARGDLAVEIGFEMVPAAQRLMIQKCNALGKPVIVATQMLELMIKSPVPTRAEVSDIASAVTLGADAIMLSEESAMGQYPVEAVHVMSSVTRQIEDMEGTHRRLRVQPENLVDSVSSSVVHVAEDISARAIVALTESGSTARVISRFRPPQTIYAVTPHAHVARQTYLSYGVEPLILPKPTSLSKVTEDIKKALLKKAVIAKGDAYVLACGIPFAEPGNTNTMMAVRV
jgi:pyruvate kinase